MYFQLIQDALRLAAIISYLPSVPGQCLPTWQQLDPIEQDIKNDGCSKIKLRLTWGQETIPEDN